MSKLLQLRGGTTSEHSSFTGAVREVTVDTTKDTLVVHDGSTAGGFALATATDVATALPKAGGAMTGAITTNSTFDGRDVATDGTKLDTIETSATADQTKADIEGLGIAASSITGALPAISGAALTNLPASGKTFKTAFQSNSGTGATLSGGSGFSSVTRLAAGKYRLNFTTSQSGSYYPVLVSPRSLNHQEVGMGTSYIQINMHSTSGGYTDAAFDIIVEDT